MPYRLPLTKVKTISDRFSEVEEQLRSDPNLKRLTTDPYANQGWGKPTNHAIYTVKKRFVPNTVSGKYCLGEEVTIPIVADPELVKRYGLDGIEIITMVSRINVTDPDNIIPNDAAILDVSLVAATGISLDYQVLIDDLGNPGDNWSTNNNPL